MKLAFLNPPRFTERVGGSLLAAYNVSRFSRGVDIVYAVTPPAEMAVLAAAAEQQHEVVFLDANARNLLPREVAQWLLAQKPDYLVLKAGDSTLLDDLYYYYFAEGIGIPTIVWEDILAPVYGEQLCREYNIRRLLWGEPERALFRFLAGETGIIGGDTIPDLDALPLPLFDALPLEAYRKEGKRNWYMFLHRGCGWGRCTFCLMEPKAISYRERSLSHIRRELEAVRTRGVETIFFWDPQFNPTRARAMALCTLLREFSFRWECWMRTDVVDDELLAAMRAAGCFRLHYGVESGDQRVLDSMDKGTAPAMIERAFTLARRHGIETAAYLCLGTWEEDAASLETTYQLLRRIRPTTIVPASFRPFPTTTMARQMREAGFLTGDHYALARSARCFGDVEVAATRHLTAEQVGGQITRFHRLATRTALCSYLVRPWLWAGLVEAFAIRTLRNWKKR